MKEVIIGDPKGECVFVGGTARRSGYLYWLTSHLFVVIYRNQSAILQYQLILSYRGVLILASFVAHSISCRLLTTCLNILGSAV